MGGCHLDLKQSLGERVRHLRTERELTQEQVAERGDLYWTQVQRIEQGKINPTLDTLERLARGLNVPISTLFAEPMVNQESVDMLIHLVAGHSESEIRLILAVTKALLANLPNQK